MSAPRQRAVRASSVQSMAMSEQYAAVEPSRTAIDKLEGPALLEFGSPWCGYCRAVAPLLASVFALHPRVSHIRIEDGSGRALGRSFRVRLWPTLIFLRDGKEVTRLVRPRDANAIRK